MGQIGSLVQTVGTRCRLVESHTAELSLIGVFSVTLAMIAASTFLFFENSVGGWVEEKRGGIQ